LALITHIADVKWAIVAAALHLSRFARDWGPTIVTIALAVFTYFLWRATGKMAEATEASSNAAKDSAGAAQT